MFKRSQLRKAGVTLPDMLAAAFLLAVFASFIAVGRYWAQPASALPPIDLSLRALPTAFFLSLSRIVIAYIICLISSLAIGYWAAHSKVAEVIIVPLIDIGQSVPATVYLPGLAIVFHAIFPQSRTGLEITAILTLYTGMAWNLMLAFYGSIKTIPREYVDTIRAYGYGPLGIFLRLELPYSMNAIVWNSMMSMAGGWFFLTVCEGFTIGERSVSLVGLGSFMTLASDNGDYTALAAGGILMVLVLIATDFFVWNPLVRWSERFQRMPSVAEQEDEEQVFNFFAKSKRITNFLRKVRRRYAVKLYVRQRRGRRVKDRSREIRILGYVVLLLAAFITIWGVYAVVHMIGEVSRSDWIEIVESALITQVRVMIAVVLSGLIMVPLGIWLGRQPRLVKRIQPIIQVVAGFPMPMIFATITMLLFQLFLPLSVISIFLMMLCAQWYLLFNVIAGAANVPQNLVEVAETAGMKNFEILRRVYFPATFSQIVTGLITAAGGAWNGCIVVEYIKIHGKVYTTKGIGAYIQRVSQEGDYNKLMAAVAILIIVIVVGNRLFWAKLYNLAETKYRMSG